MQGKNTYGFCASLGRKHSARTIVKTILASWKLASLSS